MAYVLGHRLDYEKWFPDFAGKKLYNFKTNLGEREVYLYIMIFFLHT